MAEFEIPRFFRLEGRFNRPRFLISLASVVGAWLLGIILHGVLEEHSDLAESDLNLWLVAVWAICLYLLATVIVKRLHDLNLVGTYYWLIWLPIANVIFLIYLFIKGGSIGDNQYGPPDTFLKQ